MSMSMKNVCFILVTICIATYVNSQILPSPSPNPTTRLPEMAQCLLGLMDIPGCFFEISQSIMTGKFGNIGPLCCKAFLASEANCKAEIPSNPFFPPMLKQQCSRIATPPTAVLN
ncbi:unnamed protein product [Cochlearia groenlandica]